MKHTAKTNPEKYSISMYINMQIFLPALYMYICLLTTIYMTIQFEGHAM